MEAGKLARETAKEYREWARYPESSKVIRKGEADPIREKRVPTRQTRRGPDAAGVLTSQAWGQAHYDDGTNRRTGLPRPVRTGVIAQPR